MLEALTFEIKSHWFTHWNIHESQKFEALYN